MVITTSQQINITWFQTEVFAAQGLAGGSSSLFSFSCSWKKKVGIAPDFGDKHHKTDWWWLEHGFYFPYMGCHPSHWRTPSFFRGVGSPPPTRYTWWALLPSKSWWKDCCRLCPGKGPPRSHGAAACWFHILGFAWWRCQCHVWNGDGSIATLWLFNIAMDNGPFTDDFPS